MSVEANRRASQYKGQLLAEIRGDQQRGSGELAEHALQGISHYSTLLHPRSGEDLRAALLALARELRDSRAAMVAMKNILQRWIERFERMNSSSALTVASQAQTISQRMREESHKAAASIARYAAELVEPGSTVMTHGYCPMVMAALQRLSTHKIEVIATESGPGSHGDQTRESLGKLGIPAHLIGAEQMGLFARKADLMLVGADSVLGDGSLLNHSGTLLLALAANQARVPLYVCCESDKFSAQLPATLTLEEHPREEPPSAEHPQVRRRNFCFDITPPGLISAYITETGLSHPRKSAAQRS